MVVQEVHTSVVSGSEYFQALAWMPAQIKPNIFTIPISKVDTVRGDTLLKYLHPKYFPNFLTAILQAAMLSD